MDDSNVKPKNQDTSNSNRRDFLKTAATTLAGAGLLGIIPEVSEKFDGLKFTGTAQAAEIPEYEVYALKYGEMQSFSNILWYWMGNPPLAKDQQVAVKGAFYWLIKGSDTNILFDAGTTAEIAAAGHISNYEDHGSVLGKIGLKIEDIDKIVLSHTHADHMNGAQVFESNPNISYYIQNACFDWCVNIYPNYPLLQNIHLPAEHDIEWLKRQAEKKRLKLIEAERGGKPISITPGFNVTRVDGHMVGLQIATVNTSAGPVVLTSDASYLYSNMEMGWPVGLIMGSLTDAIDGLQICKNSGNIHIPGHDITVTEKFPEVAPGVYKIA